MPAPQLDQDEIKLLHEMLRDYDRARWLRGQAKVWVMWIIGLPAVVLGVLQMFEELRKLFGKGH